MGKAHEPICCDCARIVANLRLFGLVFSALQWVKGDESAKQWQPMRTPSKGTASDEPQVVRKTGECTRGSPAASADSLRTMWRVSRDWAPARGHFLLTDILRNQCVLFNDKLQFRKNTVLKLRHNYLEVRS